MQEPTAPSEPVDRPSATRARGSRWRKLTAAVLAVVTVLAVLAGTLVMTTDENLLETDNFVALAGPLVDDPAVRATVSARVSDQVLTVLDLDERVPARLEQIGPNVALLAPPIVAAAEQFVDRSVGEVIDSEQFATLWNEALTLGHTRVIALVEGDEANLGNLVIGESDVELDLLGVVVVVARQVLGRLGDLVGVDAELPEPVSSEDRRQVIGRLADIFGVELPEDYALMSVMSAEDLESIQRWYRFVQGLGPVLLLLAMVTGAGAVIVSSDPRRLVIRIGLGLAVVALAVRIALNLVVGSAAGAAATAQGEEAAGVVAGTVLGPFATAMWWLVAIGVGVAFVAYLYGPAPMFRRTWDRVTGFAR